MTQLKRSNIHQRLYPDNNMLEAFGKLNPSLAERTTYFFELWMSRKQYELITTGTKVTEQHKILSALGLAEPWDYQLKANAYSNDTQYAIRFSNAHDLAVYKIARGKTHE